MTAANIFQQIFNFGPFLTKTHQVHAGSRYNNTLQPQIDIRPTFTQGASPVPAGQWQHLVGTYDGSNMIVYLNGTPVVITSNQGGLQYGTSKDLDIGTRSPYTSAEAFSGLIDEARISSVARSADWIATEFNNQSSPATFAVACAAQVAGSPVTNCLRPAPTTYSYIRPITINHAQVSNTDQQNFPVLISGAYADLATVANGGNVQSQQGYDIIFTSDSAGQNQLDHEIDTYNPTTGTVNFWVRIPTLSHATDTTIYMWYGNSGVAVSQENKPGVWSNGYAAVYHMGSGSSVLGTDSTGVNNGTVSGVTGVAGVIGGGGNFNGTGGQYIQLPSSASLKPTSALTLEAWVNPASFAGGYNRVFDVDYHANGSWTSPFASYGLGTTNSTAQPGLLVTVNGNNSYLAPAVALPLSAWAHLVGTYDGSAMRLYVNGTQSGSMQLSGSIDYGTSQGVTIGKSSIYHLDPAHLPCSRARFMQC